MRLFKYLHSDRTDVLKNMSVRFSSPLVLNDPFELKPYISAITSANNLESGFDEELPNSLAKEYAALPRQYRRKISLEKFIDFAKTKKTDLHSILHENANQILPVLQSKMETTFDKLIGIFCLTESPDNLLMWAHYADSHQGFVIEFDPNDTFFDRRKNVEDDFRFLRKVIYSENRPNIIMSELKDFSPFLTKGIEWNYESEWRMMDHLENATKTHGVGATAVHLFKFPKTAIKNIIFGCKLSDSKKSEIRQILNSTTDLEHVICLQANIHKSKYELTFEVAP